MLNTTVVFCFMVSLGIAFFAMFKPLFMDKQKAYYQPAGKVDEFDESISLLEAIEELQSDFKMGKLSREDFETLSLEFKRLYLEKKKQEE